ncbi:NADH:flavin oxidoreductase [Nocardioides anomalus]|uniref:NADH:flavin oxidoreductase n=1 Tax=Nocardioides anomalus TaxID=2712223 RepID=A0A6G6WEY7_9ACTN|nr:NADH:flavin oxidoreductase [Nocardioides anomalus]QIG43802.1 NADH:flavin oxidoreductase [Nocardioides anomalus]
MTDPAAPLDLLRGPAWSDRMALAPLTNKQSETDGTLSDDERHWLVARARGGFGMVLSCATYVAPEGQAWDGQLGISDERHRPGLARLAEELRAEGAVSSVQLHHGGLRADAAVSGHRLVAPWTDEAKGVRALSTGEVHAAVDAFVAAAGRAERAGFDGVEVHGAHGYLIGQFLDGRHNHREDGYGGSAEDRSRFLLEVLEGIRQTTGPAFQLGLRLSPERFGIDLGEAADLTATVLAGGHLDYLDLSLWDVRKHPHGREDGPLLLEHFADLPRHGVRLGYAGKVLSGPDVTWCLDRGADFVSIGTGAILHHDFARRVLADPGFVSTSQPVSREHLEAEHVGPAFVDYLATNWDDFVSR